MKTTITISKWFTAIAITGALMFTSCRKETSVANTEDTPAEVAATVAITSEDAEAEAQFDDVFNITASVTSEDAGDELGMGANVSGLEELGIRPTPGRQRCYTVTVVPRQPGLFPKTVTIDFGNGCLGRDGKLRKGKIVTIYTNRMLVPGAKVSTTFVGYHVDSFHVEGTHITENTSTSNMHGLKVSVIDGKITNNNTSKWHKWNSVKNSKQIEGNGTPNFPLDDIYKITGAATGSNSQGNSWSATIVEPLIKKFTCRWIGKGTVRLVSNGHEALLDYGNGNCDNLAIIYINGVGHTITL